jgi:hypothetical protein
MSDDTGLTATQRDKALNELQERQRIFYDEKESVVWIVNAIRHLSPNDNCKKSVKNDIEYCSSKDLSQSLLFYYQSIGYSWVCEGFIVDPDVVYKVDSKRNMIQQIDNTVVEIEQIVCFTEIWKRYPRGEGKKDALKHFTASVKTNDDWKNINIALDNYLQSLKNKKTEPQFIKHGSTWFNNWQDWIHPSDNMMKGSDGTHSASTKGNTGGVKPATGKYSD